MNEGMEPSDLMLTSQGNRRTLRNRCLLDLALAWKHRVLSKNMDCSSLPKTCRIRTSGCESKKLFA